MYGLQALQRLLFVFSKLNSGLKYVQGMNELVAPLYMVFCTDAPNEEAAQRAEVDAFFCFIRVLTVSEIRDLYCKTLDTASTGVASAMLQCVISRVVFTSAGASCWLDYFHCSQWFTLLSLWSFATYLKHTLSLATLQVPAESG
jgi:hypothetical protein